jgi:hypothetical protein
VSWSTKFLLIQLTLCGRVKNINIRSDRSGSSDADEGVLLHGVRPAAPS